MKTFAPIFVGWLQIRSAFAWRAMFELSPVDSSRKMCRVSLQSLLHCVYEEFLGCTSRPLHYWRSAPIVPKGRDPVGERER
ncbi:hypothetical protein M432DRAFT_264395 [Thermoascus aurantiacus ATCC 26904]